jgi:hypothetical protein
MICFLFPAAAGVISNLVRLSSSLERLQTENVKWCFFCRSQSMHAYASILASLLALHAPYHRAMHLVLRLLGLGAMFFDAAAKENRIKR